MFVGHPKVKPITTTNPHRYPLTTSNISLNTSQTHDHPNQNNPKTHGKPYQIHDHPSHMATTYLKGHPPKFKSKPQALDSKTSFQPSFTRNHKTQIKIANP